MFTKNVPASILIFLRVQKYKEACNKVLGGAWDREISTDLGVYVPIIQQYQEKIRNGSDKSKSESAAKKAANRTKRAQNASQAALEKLMGKAAASVDNKELIDEDAEENVGKFGQILEPAWDDADTIVPLEWNRIVHSAIASAGGNSGTGGGGHQLIVVYTVENAKKVEDGDVCEQGVVVVMTTVQATMVDIQEILTRSNFDMSSTVCKLCFINVFISVMSWITIHG